MKLIRNQSTSPSPLPIPRSPLPTRLTPTRVAFLCDFLLAFHRQKKTKRLLHGKQRVVAGGERPELPKAWPSRLRKLLAAAWHTDHTKRPTASEIVAALRTIKAELPAKYQRQRPSLTAGETVPNAGGSTRGDGGGAGAAEQGRRHTWGPQGSPPFGATTAAGTTATPADARRNSGAVGRRPSSTRRAVCGVGRSGGSGDVVPLVPPPLAPSSFSSTSCYSPSPVSSFEKPKKWYSVGKRPSWLASAVSAGGAEPGERGDGGRGDGGRGLGVRGRTASGRESQSDVVLDSVRRRNSASGPTGRGVIGIFVEGDSEDNKEGARQEEAKGWRGRRRETIDDDDGGTRNGRRSPTPRRRISRRRSSIVDALARESEGLSTNQASSDITREREGGDSDRQRRRNRDHPAPTKEEAALHAPGAKTATGAAIIAAAVPGSVRENDRCDVGRPPRMLSRNDSGTPTSSTQVVSDRGMLPTATIPLSGTQREGRAASESTPMDGGSGGGDGGGGEGSRKRSGAEQRERDDAGDLQPRLDAYRTSLRPEIRVAPEARKVDDVDDVSGRSSRDVYRGGRSLGKIWPSSSKVPPSPSSSAGGVPEEKEATAPRSTESIRAGLQGPQPRRAAADRNNRLSVRSAAPPGAADNELNIFAVLGAPSGVSGAAEGIERRLAVVTGKLAMPRGVSPRV